MCEVWRNLVDALDLGSSLFIQVWVQVPPPLARNLMVKVFGIRKLEFWIVKVEENKIGLKDKLVNILEKKK